MANFFHHLISVSDVFGAILCWILAQIVWAFLSGVYHGVKEIWK